VEPNSSLSSIWPSSVMQRRAVCWRFPDVSEVLACSTIRAISNNDGGSKHLWNVDKFYQTTRRKNPEDGHLRARRREKLRSRLLRRSQEPATGHYPVPTPHNSVVKPLQGTPTAYNETALFKAPSDNVYGNTCRFAKKRNCRCVR
jgi:hypothetical protein